MLRVLADNPYHALALDDLALLAHRLNGCSNLHSLLILLPAILDIIKRPARKEPNVIVP